jgi:uncharacterized repeat protein (TIGR02543 family)
LGLFGYTGTVTFAAGSPFSIIDGVLYEKTSDGQVLRAALDVSLGSQTNGKYVVADGTTEIGTYAFGGKSGDATVNCAYPYLTSVEMPDTVMKIGKAAFSGTSKSSTYGAYNLESVTLSKNLTEIGDSAFSNPSLTSIELPTTLTTIGQQAFSGTQLTSIVIPEGITSIPKQAFSTKTLKTIVLSSNITSIGENAFTGLNSNVAGKTLVFTGTKAPTTFNAMASATQNLTVLVPSGTIGTYQTAFSGTILDGMVTEASAYGITLDNAGPIKVGESKTFDASDVPTGCTLTVNSSNKSVATAAVGTDGKAITVTGVGAGTATITAKITLDDTDYTLVEKTATVTVNPTTTTFTPSAAYRVEHYQQNLDGTYTLAETDFPLYGALNSTVTAEAKTYDHYHLNSDKSTVSGTVVMPAVADGEVQVLTLQLYYDLDTVTVKFDSNGGTTVASRTVKYGDTATEPTSPVYSGYTFNGWFDKDGNLFDFNSPIADNTELTAGWTERVTTTTVTTPSGNNSSNNSSTTTTETLPAETDETANAQVGEEETVEVVSTETVTDAETGTVTTTTEKSDGSTTVVEEKTDGTVTTTDTAADGAVKSVEEKPDGTVTTTQTATNGVETVTVAEPGKQVTAKVTIPEDVEDTTVTIPADLTAGMVAVDADTGEIIMLSVLTDDGMAVKLDGSANIVIVDNSVEFDDVTDDHWASDAVDFATSHELFNGTSADTFTPDGDMTRAMLMTVLARFDGVDTDSGDTWYEAGMNWAVENEISDGSDPDASITREQLVTMLYRYVGAPATSGSLEGYSDAASVSSFAADAMAWAIENGILNGIDGTLAPQSTATRAQVAAIFQRLCTLMIG